MQNKDNFSRLVFRDLESRITRTDAILISEWIQSKQLVHIILDKPYQSDPDPNMVGLYISEIILGEFKTPLKYKGQNKFFLFDYILPFTGNSLLVHYNQYNEVYFPIKLPIQESSDRIIDSQCILDYVGQKVDKMNRKIVENEQNIDSISVIVEDNSIEQLIIMIKV